VKTNSLPVAAPKRWNERIGIHNFKTQPCELAGHSILRGALYSGGRILLAILAVLVVSLSSSPGASLLLDGDFDSLPVGNAPDVGAPAGHWFFPVDYAEVAETNTSEFSIAVAPGGTNGNSLHVLADASMLGSQHLPNIFTLSINKGAGLIVIASFDIYVTPGHGGGAVYLGDGFDLANQRGPQLGWGVGTMSYRAPDANYVIGNYDQGIWQSVRIETDVDNDRYNLYAGPRGMPFSLVSSNLPFRSGTPPPYIDRFNITRFEGADVDSYFDNVVVELASASAPQLIITRSVASVILTWPANTIGFTLQSTASLVPPVVWNTNLPAPVVINGQFVVTAPISAMQQFYRLSR
jgi:hypothetical protein